jgi:hypothetical protein
MDSLLDSIGAAIADGATPDKRAAGALACRTLLAALEVGRSAAAPPTAPVTPLPIAAPVLPVAQPSPEVTALHTHVATIAGALKAGMPVEKVVDLVVQRLETAVKEKEARWMTLMRGPIEGSASPSSGIPGALMPGVPFPGAPWPPGSPWLGAPWPTSPWSSSTIPAAVAGSSHSPATAPVMPQPMQAAQFPMVRLPKAAPPLRAASPTRTAAVPRNRPAPPRAPTVPPRVVSPVAAHATMPRPVPTAPAGRAPAPSVATRAPMPRAVPTAPAGSTMTAAAPVASPVAQPASAVASAAPISASAVPVAPSAPRA